MSRIKYTPQGFSYVDVTIEEVLIWGGYGICNDCGKISEELKLIWVLNDCYCKQCFNAWVEGAKNYPKHEIEEDLALQKDNDIRWYKNYGVFYDKE